MEHENDGILEILSRNDVEAVFGGSLYSELNDAYEAMKEFGRSFWEGAKKGYGID